MGRKGRLAVWVSAGCAVLAAAASPVGASATSAPVVPGGTRVAAPAPAAAPQEGAAVQRGARRAAPTGERVEARPASGSAEYSYDGQTFTVRGAILERYLAEGAEHGALGRPVTSEVVLPGGAFTHFQNGSVYWSPTGGARVVRGSVRDLWEAHGWETSFLDYPVSEEGPAGGGAVQRFRGGDVYWSPATGPQFLRGAILQRYLAAGAETGPLGFPVTSEVGLRAGAFTSFQNGAVYWSPRSGAHVVQGRILGAWAGLGWESSGFGYPTSGERPVAGGVVQDFEGGQITHLHDGDVVRLHHR
ncbi:LGFP repeat-containing protein [Kineococcus xinjiangensis]|uniref:LGFP repeat-containing protein n=1 Tax=Kineococcus xinjiangensis TaxID=512762 RepID=A0A2S6IDT7_9ACTN|nr:hypothetical protein [Kineococcus xinjiangensis]PPK92343.1 LGFP repeat-containing protein [Kineococcus xinjiangensis]